MRKNFLESENEGSVSRLLSASKIFFLIFLIFTMLFVVVYSFADEEPLKFDDRVTYIENWTVADTEGNVFETGRYYRDDRPYTGPFSIMSKLPAKVEDNTVLCFIANRDVAVYINGTCRKLLDTSEENFLPGGHVKRFYMTIPLTASDSGADIIIVRSTNSSQPEMVPEAFITTELGLYQLLMEKYGVSFVLSIILLIFSIAVIAIGIGMQFRFRMKIYMLYGALGIFDIAAWLVTNSYLYPFVFGHYHVDGIANFMFCLMMPFSLILYLDAIQMGRYRKYMVVLTVISMINAALWTSLHFTKIMSFMNSLLYIDIVLGALILSTLIIIFIDYRKGNIGDYKYTAIGFAGFLIFSLLEIVSLVFKLNNINHLPMLIGLMFLLTFVVAQQVFDLRVISLEKQKAVALSDAKTKFLASMSHEIRTPINSILGMNEMIIKENRDKVIDEYARTVQSSGRMLLTLVNDVLDFSKIEAGKLEIMNVDYSISRVFSEVLPMLKERAKVKGLELEIRIKDEVPDGQTGDEFRLKQILVNLIGNAVKYTDKGFVTVTLGGEYAKDKNRFDLTISVADTGRGIKPEEISRLFDAFSRADMRKNRNIEGTGLGLAIVKSIINSMDGTINVESEYGKGSEFKVAIPVGVYDRTPVKDDLSGKSAEPVEEYKCDFRAPNAKILAVDDNSSNLKIVKLFLKETGITPDLSMSGKEAIELCKKTKYDLIFLDHMMPAPDGIETLKMIKKDPESLNRDTKVVVLTANAIAGSRQMYLSAGFADYLTKPIDSRKLLITLKEMLPADLKELIVHDRKEQAEDKPVRKVLTEKKPKKKSDENDFYIMEFLPKTNGTKDSELRKHMAEISGIDFDKGLLHCGGSESVYREILSDLANDCGNRVMRMRMNILSEKFDLYCIDAHAIKGLMATIGWKDMSELAKKHEFAVKEENLEFVRNEYEAFLDAYQSACASIKKCIA